MVNVDGREVAERLGFELHLRNGVVCLAHLLVLHVELVVLYAVEYLLL